MDYTCVCLPTAAADVSPTAANRRGWLLPLRTMACGTLGSTTPTQSTSQTPGWCRCAGWVARLSAQGLDKSVTRSLSAACQHTQVAVKGGWARASHEAHNLSCQAAVLGLRLTMDWTGPVKTRLQPQDCVTLLTLLTQTRVGVVCVRLPAGQVDRRSHLPALRSRAGRSAHQRPHNRCVGAAGTANLTRHTWQGRVLVSSTATPAAHSTPPQQLPSRARTCQHAAAASPPAPVQAACWRLLQRPSLHLGV